MNPMTTRPRRRYTDEQRAEAVELCIKENLPCSQVAKRLDLHPSILSRWVRQARIDRGEALPVDHGLLNSAEREELSRLRKENRELRREKDFFKLAAAHFAREQLPQKGFG
jgi:transposase-like protein